MTHSLSTRAADRPPAMYCRATLAIVVSRTSMNVGMTTAMATIQGLIAGRLIAAGARATLLMIHPPWQTGSCCGSMLGDRGALRQGGERLQERAGVGTPGRL